MSSFMVTSAHVDALIAFAAAQEPPVTIRIPADSPVSDGSDIILNPRVQDHADAIGRTLLEQNARSVEALYGDREGVAPAGFAQAERYRFTPYPLDALTPANVLAHCTFYAYQACEGEQWSMSLAQHIVDRIRERAADELRTPDVWGIDENPNRGPELKPEPAADGADAGEAAGRAALLARMSAKLTPAPAEGEGTAPDAPAAGPKPEPEVTAKRRRRPRLATVDGAAVAPPAAPEGQAPAAPDAAETLEPAESQLLKVEGGAMVPATAADLAAVQREHRPDAPAPDSASQHSLTLEEAVGPELAAEVRAANAAAADGAAKDTAPEATPPAPKGRRRKAKAEKAAA